MLFRKFRRDYRWKAGRLHRVHLVASTSSLDQRVRIVSQPVAHAARPGPSCGLIPPRTVSCDSPLSLFGGDRAPRPAMDEHYVDRVTGLPNETSSDRSGARLLSRGTCRRRYASISKSLQTRRIYSFG